MKKILITGGAGFIGINAAEHFINKGFFVKIFDNFSRDLVEENIKWLKSNYEGKFEVIKADVTTDIDTLQKTVNESDLVIHLAAQVAVTTSIQDPKSDLNTNAIGTFNVLEAIRKSPNQPSLLYSSTNKVYGALESLEVNEEEKRYEFQNKQGVSEEQNLDFHSPYGCSKGAADQYVRDYHRIYGLKTVVFRQSCIYGPHQFGIEDQGWVAWFIIACLLNKDITIYGNGKQVRDILFVKDLVNAYDLALESIEKTQGKIFNIGGGYVNSLSLLEFIKNLEKLMGKKINFSFSDWRPGDQPIFISDNSYADKVFGWQPKISKDAGINEIYEWLKDNIDLIKK
ncbi:MAG: GDP-mannose 4,6-dehydratase [Candidatus Buchananbacteria bacterium]